MQRFFYDHLQEDLRALRDFLSINDNDVVLLLHLIAKSILTSAPISEASIKESMLTENSRNTWEQDFSAVHIIPVIQVSILGDYCNLHALLTIRFCQNFSNQISEARLQILSDREQLQGVSKHELFLHY